MLCAAGVDTLIAVGPPVIVGVGSSGFGSTFCAVAWPLLVTVIARPNTCPRLQVARLMVKLVTASEGGDCTVVVPEENGGAVTVAALMASAPVAPAVSWIVPGPPDCV